MHAPCRRNRARVRASALAGLILLPAAAVAAVALWAADRLPQPVPLSAALAVAGGFVGLWFAPWSGWWRAWAGAAVGLLSGVAVHVYWHLSGQSTNPVKGLVTHIAGDGLQGLAVAVPALAAAAFLRAIAARVLGSEAADG